MSDANHRELTGVEKWALWLHKLVCSYCRKVAEQMRMVDEAARKRASAAAKLPDDARQRIVAALKGKADE